ncbi:hypothetical protein Kpol_1048p12 [Vanderwaltozyma polyspora DSM 70294]|uniref:Uncharacterized protein n=1 Tax=Vanderwaltozyma polyspora (strain ATCC 22028 / DSM 70294 / BCRC 21397 / CBS 2163 / NBRC 10782 / NRRL Y-8283 / UCD 57-17) TaxID=436907 RepID=A7TGH5_VANPO|nr:uncharacterized protein Kpol_1048p12 [Vanderwaltozyma polyspora DSM 70294]EDO18582.1 hypothetical protein Kpol_1048p12 [Vanderwaltozyma polyspora DSM 70294]
MSLNLENVLGFKVKVTNVLDMVTEGTVYSYNSSNNTITIQTSLKKGVGSFKIIKCSFIKSVDVIGEKPLNNTFKKQQLKPSFVNLDRVQKSLDNTLVEVTKRDVLVGKGVSKQGQAIFDALYKTFSDTRWSGKNIIVLDDVQLEPAYKLNNVKPLGDVKPETVEMIKKIVERTWERLTAEGLDDDENERKGG